MGKKVKLEGLSAAIEQELTSYHESIVEKLDAAGDAAVKKLVKLTKATAPVGKRGSYRKNIAGRRLFKTKRASKHAWFVKAPDYRLTHLLIRPHPTPNGSQTKGDPFLKNAVDEVLPEYENAVKEAIENG